MAKNATVSQELANKFATEKETPYLRWVRDEGLDIISAHYIPNLRTVALKPWTRRGGAGVFINHEASRTSNDCYVCEIPPGAKLAPQRQGAWRRRRPHPLQHGEGHHCEPHLAIPDRHLQEGACPRARRPCHRAQRRGLLPDVAGRRRAAPLRLANRDYDRASQRLVP